MGKPTKQHRKRKFNYDKNRRKEWLKSKKMPTIECKQVKNAWDSKRSVKENMLEMGLATDPNKTISIPKTKDSLVTSIPGSSKKTEMKEEAAPAVKQYVALELEAEANIPQRRRLRLSEPETRYCIYMMEKYGEDYKAMARDMRNYYQDTPKQIKSKIKAFKSIPEQYGEYLKSKGVKDVLSEEGLTTPTRRTIDMAVVQRHDTRKRRAKRRNGHYTTPPGRVPTPAKRSGTKSEDIPWHKVKRKLHFGRVPPRPRTNSSSQAARPLRFQKPKGGHSPRKSVTASVAHKPGLSRELHHLLTSACFVPVRLRSTFKNWGHNCHVDQPKQHGCKLHSSHELTNLKITDATHSQISRSKRISRRSYNRGYKLHSSQEKTNLVLPSHRSPQGAR
ncbi:uncharacterized protein LOC132548399 [Ylistrum balloti]|uniref:uncharacterized protein LOC132548399 n=1 Tax=Ylistrum balloti TaxID=509963 RepID=UPI0029059DAC|nr:uncharacterized protein LOC132548399 [Ylistrum balloti]